MKNVGRDQLVLDKIFGAQLFIPDCEVLEHDKFECLEKNFHSLRWCLAVFSESTSSTIWCFTIFSYHSLEVLIKSTYKTKHVYSLLTDSFTKHARCRLCKN